MDIQEWIENHLCFALDVIQNVAYTITRCHPVADEVRQRVGKVDNMIKILKTGRV